MFLGRLGAGLGTVSLATVMPRQSCRYCAYCCDTLLQLTKHMFEAHSFEPTFSYACGIGRCTHIYKAGSTFSSFKTHVNRKHPNWQDEIENMSPTGELAAVVLRDGSPSEDCDPLTPLINEQHLHDDLDAANREAELETACEETPNKDHPSAERAAATFLLTFKERFKLPQASTDFAVGAINGIIDSVCESVKKSVENVFDSSQTPTKEEVMRHIQHNDPFSSLQTEYQQTKFYRAEFGLVVRDVQPVFILM